MALATKITAERANTPRSRPSRGNVIEVGNQPTEYLFLTSKNLVYHMPLDMHTVILYRLLPKLNHLHRLMLREKCEQKSASRLRKSSDRAYISPCGPTKVYRDRARTAVGVCARACTDDKPVSRLSYVCTTNRSVGYLIRRKLEFS